MNKSLYKDYLNLLRAELQVALGCTEPVAIAYASAYARSLLNSDFEYIELHCSGNIVKNALSVTVPNSGGMRGIKVAALLGAIGGDPKLELACLTPITDHDRLLCTKFLKEQKCKLNCLCDVPGLDIIVDIYSVDGHKATVEIKDSHSNIVRTEVDGVSIDRSKVSDTLFREIARQDSKINHDEIDHVIGTSCEGAVLIPNLGENNKINPLELRKKLELKEIINFAEEVDIEDVREVIERQIKLN